MLRFLFSTAVVSLLLSCGSSHKMTKKGVWISLFDGKTLNGWRINENPATFKVEDGHIVVNGYRGHAFYDGAVANHDFKNFELKLRVMTTPGSNSGVYFHTVYQDSGFPVKGFEAQVNNSHADWRRSGSVYGLQDIKEVFVKDNEWYDMYIRVQDKKITIKLNDRVVNEYTEPENFQPTKGNEQRLISSGTFALQGHDPKSKVLFKEIFVKIN